MLVASHDGERCLLGRKGAWPPGRWSTLAGFVEFGESLEECVAREVLEESGVVIDRSSVRNVASQPWLFPRSLMVGYLATATQNAAAVPTDLLVDEVLAIQSALPLLDDAVKEAQAALLGPSRVRHGGLRGCGAASAARYCYSCNYSTISYLSNSGAAIVAFVSLVLCAMCMLHAGKFFIMSTEFDKNISD